ncbi:hypothetical protein PJK55_13765 [Exiguobacterium sp. MMG028]|uniref:hypothetical protein n=1 Tax=Exiguobacterium sp. MMG028 TaxID=3021979 RepID=UPI0022FE448B|nr:hypothetical protein [Exiguobacterium sp. MMG028]MDA5561803.1 hypothetical protein [Exiguobacterium sp. MMG028]
MIREYNGEVLVLLGALTTILLLFSFFAIKSRLRRQFIVSSLLLVTGYILFLVGMTIVRGWDALGWLALGLILYVLGMILHVGTVIYQKLKSRHEGQS